MSALLEPTCSSGKDEAAQDRNVERHVEQRPVPDEGIGAAANEQPAKQDERHQGNHDPQHDRWQEEAEEFERPQAPDVEAGHRIAAVRKARSSTSRSAMKRSEARACASSIASVVVRVAACVGVGVASSARRARVAAMAVAISSTIP